MIRKGLKLQLALALDEVLGFQHALTIPNAKRYVDSDVRRKYRIRAETQIELEDWIVAIQVLRIDHVNHFVRVSNDDRTPAEERFTRILDSLHIISRSNESEPPRVSQYV